MRPSPYRAVLDASALLAVMLDEPGKFQVLEALGGETAISAINYAEVLTVLARKGHSVADAHVFLSAQPIRVLPFEANAAIQTAELAQHTAPHGLSLGDRACLALGAQLNCPILTADRAWAGLTPWVQVIR